MSLSQKLNGFINAKRKRSENSSGNEAMSKKPKSLLMQLTPEKPRVQEEHSEEALAEAEDYKQYWKAVLRQNLDPLQVVDTSFIKQCETFWSDGEVGRDIVVVDLENIPQQLRGEYDTLAYKNRQGKLVRKQAFYRSSGQNSALSGTWLPFDGITYYSENGQTQFEKDNFNSRFGGFKWELDECRAKLGLVSQVLGGGVWDIDARKKIEANLERVETILRTKKDPEDPSYRVAYLGYVIVEDLPNPWHDPKAMSRESMKYPPPNPFVMVKAGETAPQKLRLSAGVEVQEQKPWFWQTRNFLDVKSYRRGAAKRINKCIGTANSHGIDMATLGGGFASREQYEKAVKSLGVA